MTTRSSNHRPRSTTFRHFLLEAAPTALQADTYAGSCTNLSSPVRLLRLANEPAWLLDLVVAPLELPR